MRQDFDFHIHSKYSDGEFSVEHIIKLLEVLNINKFAITDHDSVDSVLYLRGKKCNYISGVEMSSRYMDTNMHILGYYIDGDLSKLQELCKKVRLARKSRLEEHISKLTAKFNLEFSQKDIDIITSDTSTLGRPHIGRLLIKYGYVNSMEEAFEKYLYKVHSSIFYRTDAKIVIDAIHEAGGIAILAHPKDIEKKYKIDIEEFLPHLIEIGIDGIEVYNSIHQFEDTIRYKKLAEKYELLTSGGSDYHGPNVKGKVKLGVVTKDYIPKINIDELTFQKKD